MPAFTFFYLLAETFLFISAENGLRGSAWETGAEPGNGGGGGGQPIGFILCGQSRSGGAMLNATIESCSRTFVYE